MNWRNVRLIASREVQDQVRDRRTLFMVLVLPLVLYPALAIGMIEMQTFVTEQVKTVVVLGAEHLPTDERYELIDTQRGTFHAGWFASPVNVNKLRVVSDRPAPKPLPTADGRPPAPRPVAEVRADAKLIVAAKEIRKKVERRSEIERELRAASKSGKGVPEPTEQDDPRTTELHEELVLLNTELGRLFAETEMQVLIVIPEGFAEHLDRVNEQLEDRGENPDAPAAAPAPKPLVIRNSADEKSRIAYGRVTEALAAWKNHIIRDRLSLADLPPSITDVDTESVEIAGNEEFTASLWGKMIPALLIIMCVTGAFHPAVDLAAGEKERGTMETLLICPASRTEIVIGKFLTILLFSVTTAMLNLVSMGLTAAYIIYMRNSSEAPEGAAFTSLGFPGFDAVAWVIVFSLPLASLFSALCLSLSTFARSVKEGQYYLTPLLMVTMGLTVFCMSPGVEITPLTSIMPIVGPALLLKQLLASSGGAGLVYVIPVLATSIGYSAIALWWAIDQFQREDVLFREAERFEVRLWWRHLMRDKEATPSFAEGVFCLILMVFLQFATIGVFQGHAGAPGSPGYGTRSLQLLMVQQLAFFATPPLLMAVMLTTNPLRTLRIRRPPWRFLGVAVLLAVVLRPVVLETMAWLDTWFFPELPAAFTEQLRLATATEIPIGLALLAFAVLPGVCEEIAFRGFLLSAFESRGRVWLAIILSSIAFGVIHMVPQMVLHAAVLGLVIGLLAVRSGSLFVCMAFHIVSNAVTVLNARVATLPDRLDWYEYLVHRTPGSIHFRTPVVIVSAIASLLLLRWLLLAKPPADAPESSAVPAIEPSDLDDAPLEREPASVG